MRFEKGEKKVRQRRIQTQVDRIKNDYGMGFTIYASGALVTLVYL